MSKYGPKEKPLQYLGPGRRAKFYGTESDNIIYIITIKYTQVLTSVGKSIISKNSVSSGASPVDRRMTSAAEAPMAYISMRLERKLSMNG